MTSSDAAVLEAADVLARSIEASAEWRALLDAQKAAETDPKFARMTARQNELAAIQNSARSSGQGLDGKSRVELITVREHIQRHELYARQQEAGSAVVRLFQRINARISQGLGLDFARNAAPRQGGCCG